MREQLSQRLFGDKAILVTANIADYRESLYPSEIVLITGAVEKRVLEFSTGRYCAHQALHALGIDDFAILRGEQRDPVWPANIVGSISHCRDIAGAVVTDRRHAKSVGLDIENRKQINPDIARHVCTDDEKRWLDTLALNQRNTMLLQIFSIKEAIFKCIYQATREQPGFKQCQVMPGKQDYLDRAQIRLSGLPVQHGEITVNSTCSENHIYSGAVWHHLPAVG